MYKILNMKIEHVLKLIHYFRMSKHARSHLEKDDPRTPPYMEEEDASPTHNDLTYRIEEAMEEEADMSSTGRGGEGEDPEIVYFAVPQISGTGGFSKFDQ